MEELCDLPGLSVAIDGVCPYRTKMSEIRFFDILYVRTLGDCNKNRQCFKDQRRNKTLVPGDSSKGCGRQSYPEPMGLSFMDANR